MSSLPFGWAVKALGEVADTALGKMLDRGHARGHEEVPYLRNVNVQWGRIDIENLLTMQLSPDEHRRFQVLPGDLLVCEGGEVGRSAVWRGGVEYIAYQKALHRVRSDHLDAGFMRFLFEHYASTGMLRRFSTGSTIAHLPQQRLRELPIPFPSWDEQRRIVDILEDHLSRLDAAQEQLTHVARRAESLLTTSLAHHVGGATPDWSRTTVGAQAERVEYGSGAKAGVAGPSDSIPVLRMGNLKNGRLDWTSLKYLPVDHPDLPRLMLAPGDLLFNRTNSAEHVGKSAVFDGNRPTTFASYLIRVRFLDRVNPHWAKMAINSPQGRAHVATVVSQQVGQANVNGTKLKAFPIPLPRRDEQDRRVAEHANLEDSVQRLRTAVAEADSRSAALRGALLRAAFSGQLTGQASDLDRAEEMAAT